MLIPPAPRDVHRQGIKKDYANLIGLHLGQRGRAFRLPELNSSPVTDGGGKAPAFARSVTGAEKVLRCLPPLEPREVNGQPGAILRDQDGKVLTTLTLDILGGQVQTICSVSNPDKLGHVGPVADAWAVAREANLARRPRTGRTPAAGAALRLARSVSGPAPARTRPAARPPHGRTVPGPRPTAACGGRPATAVGELTDHRDVALDTPDDRVADRGSVARVPVRVQEQVEPPAPVSRVAESGLPGDLRRQQRHPGQRRERQVVLAPGRAGSVPVDEADQRAVGPYGVPRRRVQVSDHRSGLPRPAGEPDGVLGWPEGRGRVVQPPEPRADLPERVVGAQPARPRPGLAQGLAVQERQALAALVIEAAGSRSAVEAGVFEVPQHRVHGCRPRLRGASDFPADAHGSELRPPGSRRSVISWFYRDQTLTATE